MITPLYYYYPEDRQVMEFRNEYFFGKDLIVCPITTPTAFDSGMATVKAYIPAGIWTDALTGRVYRGGRTANLNRKLEDEPVLARAGAIVPLAKDMGGDNSVANPSEMDVYVFPGASGAYTLYEDGGDGYDYKDGKCAFTDFAFNWGEEATFTVKTRGDLSFIPKRSFTLHFRGFEKGIEAVGDKVISQSYDEVTHTPSVELDAVEAGESLEIKLTGVAPYANGNYKEDALEFLMGAQIPVLEKTAIYNVYKKATCKEDIAISLNSLKLSDSIRDALFEITFC
jgi:hypothetical protein